MLEDWLRSLFYRNKNVILRKIHFFNKCTSTDNLIYVTLVHVFRHSQSLPVNIEKTFFRYVPFGIMVNVKNIKKFLFALCDQMHLKYSSLISANLGNGYLGQCRPMRKCNDVILVTVTASPNGTEILANYRSCRAESWNVVISVFSQINTNGQSPHGRIIFCTLLTNQNCWIQLERESVPQTDHINCLRNLRTPPRSASGRQLHSIAATCKKSLSNKPSELNKNWRVTHVDQLHATVLSFCWSSDDVQ